MSFHVDFYVDEFKYLWKEVRRVYIVLICHSETGGKTSRMALLRNVIEIIR